MKAYGALNSSIESIREFDTPNPIPAADEILIRVRAVSLNPVDTKVRSLIGSDDLDAPRILGFDAAGTVESVGASVENFSPGDEVYYSGDVTRPGSNAELHTVQAALVAKKPSSFTFPEAAALPLVTITAWELLFERMSDGTFPPNTAILIINGAGGVGSALIPLAKSAGLTVVATASRAETSEWCTQLGADHVINHREPLRPQAEAIGFKQFPLIANLHNTETYWETTADLLAPFGALGLIVETKNPIDIGNPFRLKSPRIVWEYMPTRSRFQTADMHRQGEILAEIAKRCDAGTFPKLNTTHLGSLSAANLQEAHRQLESATTIGKLTIDLNPSTMESNDIDDQKI
ncbi:MAG: zinc-binding alcohol dehydrogenase family protein [Verrucomicrobia bacterium]|jgi:NADPH2:quinone reductase|nr:zinc-binding alcohol dehydrogenase family protein [Verrucomicrobiota bacterium]|tara:strand:- start:8726 stop:9769 length:1044 start_codon:yes stop_codon:yes gene_type:complete